MENGIVEYILNEKDLTQREIIVEKLSRKVKIFYDKTVIFKTEILKMFIEFSKLKVDEETILLAMLLCNCKKPLYFNEMDKLKTFALEGAKYLRELGFDKKFCNICEGVNRYSGQTRTDESDILEVVDKFGGLILDRQERDGYSVNDALILLEQRNLKGIENKYMEIFKDFVTTTNGYTIKEQINVGIFDRLKTIYKNSVDVVDFIVKLDRDYRPKIDNLTNNTKEIKNEEKDENKAIFSKEAVERIFAKSGEGVV